MSTLEKTINMLPQLNETQIGHVFSYVSYLLSNSNEDFGNLDNNQDSDKIEILNNLKGIIKDTGKTLDEYRWERLSEKYDIDA